MKTSGSQDAAKPSPQPSPTPGTGKGSKTPAAPVHALFPQIYDELHRLAEGLFHGEHAGHTLQPTAVVHEAFVKLSDQLEGQYRDRTHFLAVAARAMRQVLIDHARARNTNRRGGGCGGKDWKRITLSGLTATIGGPGSGEGIDLLALDDALAALATFDERQGKVAELRLFGGLSSSQIAQLLDVSKRTVELDWRFARAWLDQKLSGARPDESMNEGKNEAGGCQTSD